MDPINLTQTEWSRWKEGRGLLIMSEDSDDGSEWSERKDFYVNFDPNTQLWTLVISCRTVEADQSDAEFEERTEEIIGPHPIGSLRDLLSDHHCEFSDELAQEVIKRTT